LIFMLIMLISSPLIVYKIKSIISAL